MPSSISKVRVEPVREGLAHGSANAFHQQTFVIWVALGLAFPFGLGVAITGTITGGLTA